MAEKKNAKTHAAGDGSDIPPESVELDGSIVTAAKSTMIGESYEKGYPLPHPFVGMNQTNKVAKK